MRDRTAGRDTPAWRRILLLSGTQGSLSYVETLTVMALPECPRSAPSVTCHPHS